MTELLLKNLERNFTLNDFSIIFSNTGLDEFFPNSTFNWQFEEDPFACCLRIFDNKNNLWFLYKLRDRIKDGPNWKPQPLTTWPYNSQTDIPLIGSIERSRYQGNPDYPLNSVFTSEEADFIKNPFEAIPFKNPSIENLSKWFSLWKRVVDNELIVFPGQFSSQPFPSEISHKIFQNTIDLLTKSGYKYLTSVPSYLHVVLANLKQGFKFQFTEDNEKINQIFERLTITNIEERKLASWLMVFQFWAELVISSNFTLSQFPNSEQYVLFDKNGKILTFPLRPERNLWMYREL